ncbi:MAG: hypothetical protein ACXWE7_14345, partial [Nitrososphaeraceae archaeon]
DSTISTPAKKSNSHSDNKNNLKLIGTMDISTNGIIKCKNIKTDISICDDNTIVIDFEYKRILGN